MHGYGEVDTIKKRLGTEFSLSKTKMYTECIPSCSYPSSEMVIVYW